MIRILAVLGLWLMAAGPGWTQSGGFSEADRTAIREVIERQLEAFRRDDGVAAFAYASPEIQRQFRTPEFFMHMVRQGYPQVYRSTEADFREFVATGGTPTQAVLVVGPDGSAAMALYRMERQPDGSWRIDGCLLLDSAESAT